MPTPTSQTQETVITLNHPLINQALCTLRDKSTPCHIFRETTHTIGRHLMIEATRHLPQVQQSVETPLETDLFPTVDPTHSTIICPILRAGLGLSDSAIDILPTATVHHIGLYRDEETLQPVSYYNKMPQVSQPDNTTAFLVDPMLATGGSAIAAVKCLNETGLADAHIIFVCLIAAPEGIQALQQAHPKVRIVTAAIDRQLNDVGYIVPGLGDAGDRIFAT
jgi:uracil phosphoribosyltransferase